MKKIILFVAILVLLVCIPAVVRAAKPESTGNIVDRIIALENKAPSPVLWEVSDWEINESDDLIEARRECKWEDVMIENRGESRAILTTNNGPYYGIGTCDFIRFDNVTFPVEYPITLEVWVLWMGNEEHKEVTF